MTAPSDSVGATSEAASSASTDAPAPATAVPGPPGAPVLELHGYGLIGDTRTAALVSREGSIDWACLPRFDSPSVFARLLDAERGGSCRVGPVEPHTSYQQYVGATNILTTRFVLRRGLILTVTDFMPIGGKPTAEEAPRIVRRLGARGGPIAVRVAADPRFDYARAPAAWRLEGERAVAEGAGERLGLRGPWCWSRAGPAAHAEGIVAPGRPEFVELGWGGLSEGGPPPETLLSLTDAYWRGWVSPEDAPLRRVAARWHPWVERSELVLKLLSYSDSGVFVAAPTTSLPEWLGGARNWDYRYVWLRDAAFTAQVFLLLGHLPEARAYVRWAFERAKPTLEGAGLRSLYAVDGGDPPPETELAELAGYRASRPVRFGNAAVLQRQLDVYGELLDAAALLERFDPAFVRDHWATVEALADTAAQLWTSPDYGIWESRNGPAQYVHSKLMCWVALDRATGLGRALGRTDHVELWERSAQRVREVILTEGYDAAAGAFTQRLGAPELDASALRIPLVGFLPADDARVVGTVRAVERELADGPFVYRYRRPDGQDGPEGAFLLASFWLVECLAKGGQIARARQHWQALLESGGPLLLFSEEHDPGSGLALGNYPQAFTHIGLLRAALALGLVASDE